MWEILARGELIYHSFIKLAFERVGAIGRSILRRVPRDVVSVMPFHIPIFMFYSKLIVNYVSELFHKY